MHGPSIQFSSSLDEVADVEFLVTQIVLAVRHAQYVHFRCVTKVGQELQQEQKCMILKKKHLNFVTPLAWAESTEKSSSCKTGERWCQRSCAHCLDPFPVVTINKLSQKLRHRYANNIVPLSYVPGWFRRRIETDTTSSPVEPSCRRRLTRIFRHHCASEQIILEEVQCHETWRGSWCRIERSRPGKKFKATRNKYFLHCWCRQTIQHNVMTSSSPRSQEREARHLQHTSIQRRDSWSCNLSYSTCCWRHSTTWDGHEKWIRSN